MVSRYISLTIYLFIVFIHFIYIGAILFDNADSYYLIAAIVSMVLLMTIFHYKVPLKHNADLYEDFYLILFVVLGAFAAKYIQVIANFNSVLAVSLIGLLSSYIPNLNKQNNSLKDIPPAIYCGAFIAMSNDVVAFNWVFICIASAVSGILLIVSKSVFKGVGGKLGTIAFAGVVCTSFLFLLIYN
ncbi:hypothetical protein OSR52_12965 [Galbibacter sp. CMA-7]|uniref:Prepilin type IV endopeptidase peptidase domain-containing protein n=1 Tax=Galbibacter pacificus TaxID=2996052 RepID=A0ABT6FU56_9FLAO|nr:hypothetical protein [Galbibacter pacificus]